MALYQATEECGLRGFLDWRWAHVGLQADPFWVAWVARRPLMGTEEDDHARDYVAKSRIDDLRIAIDEFLKTRQLVSGKTLMCLADAAAELEEESARLVRKWD
jgi:hypothetical protein